MQKYLGFGEGRLSPLKQEAQGCVLYESVCFIAFGKNLISEKHISFSFDK
jgi:hypothetical protein